MPTLLPQARNILAIQNQKVPKLNLELWLRLTKKTLGGLLLYFWMYAKNFTFLGGLLGGKCCNLILLVAMDHM